MPWNIAFTPSGSGTVLGEPQPVGNSETEVRLNVVEILGDPGAKTTSLGSVHGLSAQSVGGIGEVTKTNTKSGLTTNVGEIRTPTANKATEAIKPRTTPIKVLPTANEKRLIGDNKYSSKHL